MNRRVLKWNLPIDDEWHAIPGTLVHAAPGSLVNEVLIWTECLEENGVVSTDGQAEYSIFGTGHALPEMAWHLKTVLMDPFVWHVYFRLDQDLTDLAVATDVRIPVR